FNPRQEIVENRGKIPLRRPADPLKFFDTRYAMAIVSPPVLSSEAKRHFARKFSSNRIGIIDDCCGLATTNIKGLEVRLVTLQYPHGCIHDVLYVCIVARLESVLVRNLRLSFKDSQAKDATYARVLIVKRLAGHLGV